MARATAMAMATAARATDPETDPAAQTDQRARRERQREIRDIHFHAALADVRPNLLPGPEVWVAHFTVWAPDADAILLGVRTDDGDEAWYFDIGDHLDHLRFLADYS